MNHLQLISSLQDKIRASLDPLHGGRDLVLLDFPDHSNVGDSAIWLGEDAYFRDRGRKVRFASALHNHRFDAMPQLRPGEAVYLHGGGNFGTIWPAHQAFRIEVLRKCRGTPVVQLPQSIHFASEADVAETAQAIAEHGGFTLMVRDLPSEAFARKHFDCRIILCPDLAFYIGPLARQAASVDYLCLLRTDLERVARDDSVATDRRVIVTDWLEEDKKAVRRRRTISRVKHRLTGAGGNRYGVYRDVAQLRLDRGIGALSKGRVVITDRLHGHIMCTLLGIPHVVLDNSYRKIGNFIDVWTAELDTLRSATDMAGAIEAAETLIR
jgi:pyruvyl transferase EpsO